MCESEACELTSTVIAVVAVYVQGLMQSSPINPAGGLLVLFFGRYVLLVSGTPHETPSELCVSFGANCTLNVIALSTVHTVCVHWGCVWCESLTIMHIFLLYRPSTLLPRAC